MATTEQALEAQRQARIKAEQLAWENAQRGYTVAQEDITQNADKLAQETWTQKKVQEKALPNVMQQAGLSTTGYTETTANNINTNYQNAWNQVMGNKQTGLRDVGIAKANAENDYNARLSNVEADYQASLAQYLASQRNSGGGDGGTGNVVTNEAIINGMNNIQWDPYKGVAGQQPLIDYLQKYVDNGTISDETAYTWLQNYIARFTQSNTRTGDTGTRATTNTQTTTTSKLPATNLTTQQQYVKRGTEVQPTKNTQIIAY